MKLIKYFGVIPNNRKGEITMIVKTLVKILNVKSNKYTGRDGVERESFKVTFSQDDDNIVGEANVSQEVFNAVEKGKEYELTGEYRQTKNGNFISWTTAKPFLNTGKAGAI
ncbi:hypothetical protein [uncultured Bacteroides sp.]|jgi:signal transduction histidine kinase|uniref:hypothetical protein n=1 Tax=uncultured Bacteroides sp. TaxID=162156 RepID=UPI00258A9AAC|nr:hypothetical protein [uncultured Bacteroides sp.]